MRLISLLTLVLFSLSSMANEIPADPYIWLEEIQNKQALDWANQKTTETQQELEQDPTFAKTKEEALKILMAKDKVSFANYYNGMMWDIWKDEKNPRGLVRRTTVEQYKTDQPKWETVLDIDALAAKENENWVFKGGTALSKKSERRLLKLSRGGKDAVEIREFDYSTKEFVKDGFFVPEAKTRIAAIDENNLFIATDFGPDSMTDSGYPRTVRLWKRGETLKDAKIIFECDKKDVLAFAVVFGEGPEQHLLVGKYLSEVDSVNMFLYNSNGSLKQLPLPPRSSLLDIYKDFVYVQLKLELSLSDRKIAANSIVRFPLHDQNLEKAEVIFTAGPRQSLDSVIDVRGDHAYIEIMDNIKSRVLRLDRQNNGEWKQTILPFPETGVLGFSLPEREDPNGIVTLTYTDFLIPTTQYQVHMDENYRLEKLKGSPARFDASQMEVRQHFATSKDGTQIPYFIVHKKNLVLDGRHPTLLYGYGGFEVSQTPFYSGLLGKVWLEQGGVYVQANIRGGGEFGPDWHLQAIKANRQKVYDDFIAVAEDLIQRKITSPRHLGIQGGSNGGLMVASVMVQRPELFNAVVSQVPLLDMVRYTKLPPGASWMSEYGNPDVPEELAYILPLSPYQNVKPGVKYPEPLFETSRADDRVHPAHARKMVMRMIEQGHKVHFIEKADGGHGGGATLDKLAVEVSHTYSYLWKRLR